MSERLFAAVVLPSEVVTALDAWIDPRRDDEWRWTRPESWHITLAFYAAVEPWRYDVLVQHLAAAATGARPVSLTIDGVGCFPSPDKARVLYAAVSDPADSLAPLAARCRTAATTAGIEVPRERYVPHLTLARSSHPRRATRWLDALAALTTPSWQAAEIALVQSFLGAGRPRYEVRERFALGLTDS